MMAALRPRWFLDPPHFPQQVGEKGEKKCFRRMPHWMLVPMALFFHFGVARVADAIDGWPVHCARRSSMHHMQQVWRMLWPFKVLCIQWYRSINAIFMHVSSFAMDVSHFILHMSFWAIAVSIRMRTQRIWPNDKYKWAVPTEQKANSENVKIETIACILYANCEASSVLSSQLFPFGLWLRWWLHANAQSIWKIC